MYIDDKIGLALNIFVHVSVNNISNYSLCKSNGNSAYPFLQKYFEQIWFLLVKNFITLIGYISQETVDNNVEPDHLAGPKALDPDH